MRCSIHVLLMLGVVVGSTGAINWRTSWHDIKHWIQNRWDGNELEDEMRSADNKISVGYTPNLIELAAELKLTKCVEKLTEVGTNRIINHEGWFTLFCPTDEAFNNEKFYPGEDTLTDKMRLHVARGKFNSSDFKNEITYRSLLSKRTVRMNTYTANHKHMVTANGRPVVDMDHRARNGYLHVISEVMSSVYDREGSTISEIDSCCPQHDLLIDLVQHAGMYEKIDTAEPVTFLAPTNGAFTRLHPDFLVHLKGNLPLLRQVLSAHLITGTWYSAGLNQGDKLKSWAGDLVTVEKEGDSTLRFNGAKAGLTDITSGNGVTHVVESLVIPKSARRGVKNMLKMLHSN